MKTPTHPNAIPIPYRSGSDVGPAPGRISPVQSLWITFARTLAVFNITKAIRDGKEVDIMQPKFQAGLISHPEPFDIDIKPRSAGHEELILIGKKQHPWEESHAEELRLAITVGGV
ncbi:hypothetical protein BDV26DRAFT_292216 [Aspergillus bertholletiae]|uniref:Uncharacterized protein n=1 Tax=Aspergillus bertholletiae TaxID=1226010 RepID=A0A5N7B9H8_9EURO|nr:hypothetical protein BDV26DRAFT_292216 [Aspergillus bertholletiae]